MGRCPDFIGLGAQKAGTSWIYACLYEHPQVCMPLKEIHFFSRDRNWTKGYAWYESLFESCPSDRLAGEFSTSYLVEPIMAERIQQRYPQAKLIASLRNPVERAYSNYMNDIKCGVVAPSVPFEVALNDHPEYLEQGRYAAQLRQYFAIFPADQMLVLIYEDCRRDPLTFIQGIYAFLGVDATFVPSMVTTKVNASAMPRWVLLERSLIKIAGFLHHKGFRQLWWFVKKLGVANSIRKLNTAQTGRTRRELSQDGWRRRLYDELRPDLETLETLLGRELPEWRL